MITWIASYPRSGNGWFRVIMRQSFGLISVDMYADAVRQTGGQWLHDARQSPDRHFVKTHDLPGTDTDPAIYIIRDGRDCLVSYAWFTLQFDFKLKLEEITPERFHETLEFLIVHRKRRFGNWSTNIQEWRRRPNTHLIRYEELHADPLGTVQRGLRAVGLEAEPSAASPTFDEMKAVHPTVTRRGRVGGWRDEFPKDLLPLFWKTHGETMADLGYGEAPRSRWSRAG